MIVFIFFFFHQHTYQNLHHSISASFLAPCRGPGTPPPAQSVICWLANSMEENFVFFSKGHSRGQCPLMCVRLWLSGKAPGVSEKLTFFSNEPALWLPGILQGIRINGIFEMFMEKKLNLEDQRLWDPGALEAEGWELLTSISNSRDLSSPIPLQWHWKSYLETIWISSWLLE